MQLAAVLEQSGNDPVGHGCTVDRDADLFVGDTAA
jgi:hypothetical protein